MKQKKVDTVEDRNVSFFVIFNFVCAFLIVFSLIYIFPTELTYWREILVFIIVWIHISYISYLASSFVQWCDDTKRTSLAIWHRKSAKLIESTYRPLVRMLRTYDEVALASRELIVKGGGKPIYLDSRLIFLGAASNQSDKSHRQPEALIEDGGRTPAQVYQGAVDELMSNFTPVYRVISLLTETEFAQRSIEKRRQYVSWLRNQIAQLKKNKNYILYDNKRAPKWGSSGASIFTSDGYLHFTSSTGGALLVKDEWISRQLVYSIMSELEKTGPTNKQAFTQMKKEEFFSSLKDDQFGENMLPIMLEERMKNLIKQI